MLEKGQIGCRSPRPPSTPMHIMPSSPAGPPTPTTPKSVPPRVSTPATPTTPSNNNNTKLVVRALPAMAAALAGNNLQTFTVTTPSSSMPSMVAAAQGHTAMEIKQEVLEIKQEDLALNNLTSEDLSILENNLALDPSLCDTELQVYDCIIWVRSGMCGCLVTWFCYQLIAKPGNKTATHSWPDPYIANAPRYHRLASVKCPLLLPAILTHWPLRNFNEI